MAITQTPTQQSYSVASIISIGYISSYLAFAEAAKQRVYGGASLDDRIPVLIMMETENLDWANANIPDDPNLFNVANYVLSLCGRWIGTALYILGQGGNGTVIDPGTGQPISFEIYRDDFIIGGSPASDYPLNAGDTTYTLPLSNIIKNGVDWYPSGVLALIGIPGAAAINSVTYTKDYAILNFNQPVQNGEVYAVQAFRSATGTIGAGTSSFTVPLPLKEGQYLSNASGALVWNETQINYASADFEADGKTLIDTRLASHDYTIYSVDLQGMLTDGVDYSTILSGGFTLLGDWDANNNLYRFVVTLTGKS